jgi:parallel beta-helix repeat protein
VDRCGIPEPVLESTDRSDRENIAMTFNHLKLVSSRTVQLGMLALLAGACSDSGSSDGSGTDDAADDGAAMLPEGCDQYVEPGDDDQTAVQEALIEVQADQTVCLGAGTFSFTRQLSLDQDNVTIQGDSRDGTILDFTNQASGGNGVLITGDNVTVTQLTVANTPGDGIRADQVVNISFIDMTVAWDAAESMENGAYGLYPVQATGVTIQNSAVYGARDAGIYVGQSTDIIVEDSEAYGNVAGIEIENSTGADVRRNHAYDNTAGILVFNLPGLDVKDGKQANVYDNVVENNNVGNFGEPGTVVAMVPPGVGVLILSADDNEIANNEIRGNNSAGVGVILYTSSLFPDPNDPEFDIYAEGNWIHDNVFEGNGTAPDELVQLLVGTTVPAPDIMLDGCSDDTKTDDGTLANCLSNNGSATYMAVDLCTQLGGPDTDIANATCEYTPLPRK